MNRFQELSELVAGGQVDENFHRTNPRNVIDEVDTESGRMLFDSTEGVAALDLSQSTAYFAGAADINLSDVVEKIEHAEGVVEEFLKLGYPNRWYMSKSAEVMGLSSQLDEYLVERQVLLQRGFVAENGKFDRSKDNVDKRPPLRESMDKIADEYAVVHKASKKRGLKIDAEAEKTFADYALVREKVGRCDEAIALFFKRYLSVDSTEDPLKELRALKDETRNGWRKSKAVRDCHESGYYQGLAVIKGLNEDIDYVLTNFDQVSKIKGRIVAATQKLSDYSQAVYDLREGDLSLDDLAQIAVTLRSTPVAKYDSHDGVIYLHEAVLRYRDSTAAFRDKLYKLVLSQAEIDAEHQPTSTDIDQDVGYLKRKRAILTALLDEGGVESQVARAVTDWRSNIDGYIDLLNQTKETKNGIDTDTTSIKEELQGVYSLLDSVQSGGIDDDKVDTVRALRLHYNPSTHDRWNDNRYLQESVAGYVSAVKELEQTIRTTMTAVVEQYDEKIRRLESVT
ncbi:hypothetical protein KY360_03605 [Candidatus Woesearchaeota archaeon]|nr:hypothetical protein [Candidatus Woesearchaeota archaeon]